MMDFQSDNPRTGEQFRIIRERVTDYLDKKMRQV